uniref:Uncharacterized protein n=1 Tax=Cannabis sativa TaxID=3483 RepID=A0A803R1A1_CANSA
MARELISFLLLLLVANYNTHATKISEAPSPQPQLNTTTGKPYMHGITEGSLKPEVSTSVYGAMFEHAVQEAMHVLLQKVLCNMSVCASWDLWKQASMPLLQ